MIKLWTIITETMNHYTDYSAKDFALDEIFQKWVLYPNDQSDRFWSQFLEKHPFKKTEVDEAVELVQLSGLSSDTQANEAYLQVWAKLQANAKTQTNVQKSYLRYASWAA